MIALHIRLVTPIKVSRWEVTLDELCTFSFSNLFTRGSGETKKSYFPLEMLYSIPHSLILGATTPPRPLSTLLVLTMQRKVVYCTLDACGNSFHRSYFFLKAYAQFLRDIYSQCTHGTFSFAYRPRNIVREKNRSDL